MQLRAIIRKAASVIITIFWRLLGNLGQRTIVEILGKATQDSSLSILSKTVETVQTSRGKIKFHSVGNLSLWRAQTLLTKEPETIEWINGFADDDTFWDIGANIGVYTLYAGIHRQLRVVAFEPSAWNYVLLNENIKLNKLSKSVEALCLAFTETDKIDTLNMQNTDFGSALSSFGVPIDQDGKTFKPSFNQGMLGYSIDSFIETFSPSFPNQIKIDVDGIEDKIVSGASKTFADPRLKSISIELDANRPHYTDAVIQKLEMAGLSLKSKRHSAIFEDGPYAGIYNYQFSRK